MQLRVCLLSVFCSLSWFVSGQTGNLKNKEMLQGKWVYDEAYFLDDSWSMSFDLENAFFKFYGELEIGEDNISLNDTDTIMQAKYEVEENFIKVGLPEESIAAQWTVLNNKLYFEFKCSHPYDTLRKVNLFVVYRKNEASSQELESN